MKARDLILAAMFAALTAIGAFIKIPIPYVPFTLQFLFCAFSGMILGARLGALSQIVYVGTGLLGLPIFTEGGGIAYIFKPTFGYLVGFIAAAYVIGKLTERFKDLTIFKSLLIILSGLFFVYLFGVLYLYAICNLYLGKSMSFYMAIFYGFIVCFLGDIVLSLVAAVASVKIIKVTRKIGLCTYMKIEQ
ncbi:biotin transporter BioY [Clostridium lundense]|uniref:biotin transporter BioY n=1 Tax=Clostridium lundense TaxID=319475 RepID=UPI000487FB24|nr:biotin transporter BioY [Clostridium lundense]